MTPPIFLAWGWGLKGTHNVSEFVRDSEDLGRLAEHPESAGNRLSNILLQEGIIVALEGCSRMSRRMMQWSHGVARGVAPNP